MKKFYRVSGYGHIDLTHVRRVGEAYFDDRMGSGGWFVGFVLDVALLDGPLVFEWKVEPPREWYDARRSPDRMASDRIQREVEKNALESVNVLRNHLVEIWVTVDGGASWVIEGPEFQL